jgi:hypothetical protein
LLAQIHIYRLPIRIFVRSPDLAGGAGSGIRRRGAGGFGGGGLFAGGGGGGYSGGGARATAGLGGGGGSFDAGLPAFWWPVSRLATASA